jgi:hypothetical protein
VARVNDYSYLGKYTTKKGAKVVCLQEIVAGRLGVPHDARFDIYEEVKPGMVELLQNLQKAFVSLEIGDGDILVYQKALSQAEYVFWWLMRS